MGGTILVNSTLTGMNAPWSMSARLSKDWIWTPAFDLELKRYILLAYLQRIEQRFKERKLYPYLDDLREHVLELDLLRRRMEELSTGFARDLVGFDPQDGMPLRSPLPTEGPLAVIDDVIAFAMPELRQWLGAGSDLKQRIAEHIQFGPVGLMPLDARSGYLMLRKGREARVYGFAIHLLREADEELQYRSVQTRYVSTYTVGLADPFERIKLDLVARDARLPNPAAFALETELDIPHIETFMPLAKQLVYEHLRAGGVL